MPPSRVTSTPDHFGELTSPRFRFVGGKGGVGKTTCAAALALEAARSGRRTIVVSTDPAPSLGDAFAQRLGPARRRIRGVPRLDAMEMDAASAFARWLEPRRSRLEEIASRGTLLARDEIASVLRLSLPGIDEVAAFLQLAELAESERYDHVVVDTAPTGHLLRMLSMPSLLGAVTLAFDRLQEQHRQMVAALRGRWTPDAADLVLQDIEHQVLRVTRMLRDPAVSRLAWVTTAERMAIEETADGLAALGREGLTVDRLIVNRLTPAPPQPCGWCRARRVQERGWVQAASKLVRRTTAVQLVAEQANEPRGPAALRRVAASLTGRSPMRLTSSRAGVRVRTFSAPAGAAPPALMPPGTRLLMFGGKGGVGKTTCAAAAAVQEAARRPGAGVLLLSTDPAHSLGDVFAAAAGDTAAAVAGSPGNLRLRELDAQRAYQRFRDAFIGGIDQLFAEWRGRMSGDQVQPLRDLLELAPPGLDELIAIIEVTDLLLAEGSEASGDLLVVDTAPTGHALRLLEMPSLVHDWVKALMAILLEYQHVARVGELGGTLVRVSRGLTALRGLLADSGRTSFVAVTRPGALPRAETLRLARRVTDAGIHLSAVIVNATGMGSCRRCVRGGREQAAELARLTRSLEKQRPRKVQVVVAPGWLPPPKGGVELLGFSREWGPAPRAGRSRPGAAGRGRLSSAVTDG